MKTIGIAAIAAGLLLGATAVSAAEGTPADRDATARENVSVRVDASGVDFADPVAVAEFRREVERAIEQACNPGDRVNADMSPDFKCRREMAANLEPNVQRLAMRATEERRFVGVE